jgi:uncharacterized metal-binding protein YceD (DUF177 family)
MAAGGRMSTPWPSIVTLADLRRGPVRRELVADEAARRRIAEALDLVALDHLEATVTVAPWLDGAALRGRWRASVVQTCVVTLDPLPADLEGEFELKLAPRGSDAAPRPEIEITLDPQAEDPPDVIETDEIDVGAYVIEHLALELDPFPRTPGVEFEPPPAEEPASPFAILRQLKGPDAED